MRRFLMCAFVISLVSAGMIGAQMKVATPVEHDKAMKAIGGAFGGVNKAVASGMMADAKMGLMTMHENLSGVAAFWAGKKKDKQAGIAKEALAAIDAAIITIDSGGDAPAAVKMIGGQCGACHKESRDPDPATPKSFVIKPDLL